METPNIAVVTGANGFVGRHLCKRLLAAGWQVVAFSQSEATQTKASEGLTHYRLPDQLSALHDILVPLRPAAIFHLASVNETSHTIGQVSSMIRINIELPTFLLEIASRVGNTSFVSIGSAWQHYGGRDFDPIGLYGATKQSVENVATYYAKSEGVGSAQVKPFHIYGNSDPRRRLLAQLAKAACSKGKLAMSHGNNFVNLVHVTDFVSAIIQAKLECSPGEFKSFSTETPDWISIRALVAKFEEISGEGPIDIEWNKRPAPSREFMKPTSFGLLLPNWQPKVTLDQGIYSLLHHEKKLLDNVRSFTD